MGYKDLSDIRIKLKFWIRATEEKKGTKSLSYATFITTINIVYQCGFQP